MEKLKNKITKDKIEIKVRQLTAEIMTALPENQNKLNKFIQWYKPCCKWAFMALLKE